MGAGRLETEDGRTDQLPLVSIILRNYNYGHFLRDAIESVLQQTHPAIEIVVVDDGSTDGSRNIIEEYGGRIVPVLKENGGQASAWNAGFEASTGEIICFLDSDDLFQPDKAAVVVDVFARHPEAGSCFHALKLVDAGGVPFARQVRQGITGERDFRTIIRKGRLPYIAAATSALCFRRSLLAELFPTPLIDGDHYIKFAALSLAKVYFIDAQLALQRIHGDNFYTTKNNPRSKARHFIATSYWLRKRFPDLERWIDNMFAAGLANYRRIGGVEQEYQDLVAKYMSGLHPFTRLRIGLWTLYHRMTE